MSTRTFGLYHPLPAPPPRRTLALPPVDASFNLALTPLGASIKVALTPEGALRKVALSCVLQARLSCVCACTPLHQCCLRFPIALTPGEHRPRPCRRERTSVSARTPGGAAPVDSDGSRPLPECHARAASEPASASQPPSAPLPECRAGAASEPSHLCRRPPCSPGWSSRSGKPLPLRPKLSLTSVDETLKVRRHLRWLAGRFREGFVPRHGKVSFLPVPPF
jgi:hypothetical protein